MLFKSAFFSAAGNTRKSGIVAAVCWDEENGYHWQYVRPDDPQPFKAKKVCTVRDGRLLQMARTATEEEAELIKKFNAIITERTEHNKKGTMITKIYEFRIRTEGDDRAWLDIESKFTDYPIDLAAARATANLLADFTPNCKEVRFNSQGSLQGNYTNPARL